MHAEATAAGLPLGARGMIPQPGVDLPVGPAVMTLEQHPGVTAGEQEPVGLTACDHPDPLKRLVPALGECHPLGLLPLTCCVVGVEDLRPVER